MSWSAIAISIDGDGTVRGGNRSSDALERGSAKFPASGIFVRLSGSAGARENHGVRGDQCKSFPVLK